MVNLVTVFMRNIIKYRHIAANIIRNKKTNEFRNQYSVFNSINKIKRTYISMSV